MFGLDDVIEGKVFRGSSSGKGSQEIGVEYDTGKIFLGQKVYAQTLALDENMTAKISFANYSCDPTSGIIYNYGVGEECGTFTVDTEILFNSDLFNQSIQPYLPYSWSIEYMGDDMWMFDIEGDYHEESTSDLESYGISINITGEMDPGTSFELSLDGAPLYDNIMIVDYYGVLQDNSTLSWVALPSFTTANIYAFYNVYSDSSSGVITITLSQKGPSSYSSGYVTVEYIKDNIS